MRTVPEIVSGFPDRFLPKDDAAAALLRRRSMTNLYNEMPQWLENVHHDIDVAVAASYHWPSDISDEEALARLLELNLARAGAKPPLNRGQSRTREELRREPEFPPIPIEGGLSSEQPPFAADEPVPSIPRPIRRRRAN